MYMACNYEKQNDSQKFSVFCLFDGIACKPYCMWIEEGVKLACVCE